MEASPLPALPLHMLSRAIKRPFDDDDGNEEPSIAPPANPIFVAADHGRPSQLPPAKVARLGGGDDGADYCEEAFDGRDENATGVKAEDASVEEAGAAAAADSKYESGQQAGRIQLWKARVTIDKGYTALLSLIELRRLIQANAGATGLIGDLMVDVKANVDLLHSSLGVAVRVDPRDGKTIDIDDGRLASTLSMPKGRALCARAIEEGILPHSSACALLPMALGCTLSSPSCVDGEDRLIRALTGLVLLANPCVDPAIFCRCLDVPISLKRDGGNDVMSAVACSRMRMNLLHSVLSRGKDVCGADSRASEDWFQREEIFRGILEETRN